MLKSTPLVTAALITLAAGTVQASTGGFVSTDRFGYSGTVTRYGSLADANSGTGALDTINIGDRDLSLFFAQNDTVESDFNYMGGSWWYTTDASGSMGYGNTHGNTGPGFMQLYDDDASTDTSVSMNFSNLSGGFYTQFDLSVTGSNANAADYSRLSVFDNVNDGGIWHNYALNMTATGLQGIETAPGIIESTNHPVGVTGSITGVFEITENQTSPANQGFYVFNFDLSMTNWAWDNQGDLMTQDEFGDPIAGSFGDSVFRTVPAPSSLALLGLGGFAATRRRRG